MKLKGTHLTEVEAIPVPIIRGEETIILLAGPIDLELFETIVPEIEVPVKETAGSLGGGVVSQPKNPAYLKAVDARNEQRLGWMVCESIRLHTEGLEFEFYNPDDPTTFVKWQEEFKAFGCSQIENGRIIQAVMEANSLTEDKVDEARRSFLVARRAAKR